QPAEPGQRRGLVTIELRRPLRPIRHQLPLASHPAPSPAQPPGLRSDAASPAIDKKGEDRITEREGPGVHREPVARELIELVLTARLDPHVPSPGEGAVER